MQRHPAEKWASVIYALLLFLILLGFTVFFGASALHWSSKAKIMEGPVVEGVAELRDAWRRVRRQNGEHSRRYYARYRFEPPGFEPVLRESEISMGFYTGIGELRSGGGDTIPLRYSAANPDIHEIEPGSYRKRANASFIPAGVFGVLSLFSLVYVVRSMCRIRRR